MTDAPHWMKQLERWWNLNSAKDKRFVKLSAETLEDRVTPVVISGAIFEDWTRDGSFDVNREPTLDNQFVYIDSNNNGQFDKSITQTFNSTNTAPFTKFNGDPVTITGTGGTGSQFFTSIRDTIAVNIPFVSIQDINVTVNYSNTNIDLKDYDILLVSPLAGNTFRGVNFTDPSLQKITVPLWVNSDPFINVQSTNLQELRNIVFDDDAPLTLRNFTDAQAPFTGRYQPDYAYSMGKTSKFPYNAKGFPNFFTYDTLSSLIGQPVSGQWQLQIFYKNTNVTSTFFGSAGQLVDWSLEITYGEISSKTSPYQIEQKAAIPQGTANPLGLPRYSPDFSYYMDIGTSTGTAPVRVITPGESYMNTTPTVVTLNNPTQDLTYNFGFIRTAPAIYGQVIQDGNNNGKVDFVTVLDDSLTNFNGVKTDANYLDFDTDYTPTNAPQGWGDAGLGGTRVYVDTNNNGKFDTTTNNNIMRPSGPAVVIDDSPSKGTAVTTTSIINITGLNSNNMNWRVTDIRVGVNISIARSSDLILTLISPAGNRITLASLTGAGSSNFGSSTSDTIFSSKGTVVVNNAAAPYLSPALTVNGLGQVTNDAAMFKGSGTAFTLADLATSRYLGSGGFINSIAGVDGIPANGEWTLEIQDLNPNPVINNVQTTGRLNNWWLDFDTTAAEPNQITESNNYNAATWSPDGVNIFASRQLGGNGTITEDGVTRSTVPGLYRIATTGFGANVAPVAPSTLYKVRVVPPANMGVVAATQFQDTPGLAVPNPLLGSNYTTARTLSNPVYLTGGPSVTHDFLVGSSITVDPNAPVLPSIRQGPAPSLANLVVNPIMNASGPTRLNDLYIASPTTSILGTSTMDRDTITSIRLVFNGFVQFEAGAFELTRVDLGGFVTLKDSSSPGENTYPNTTAGNTTPQLLVDVTRRGRMTNDTGGPIGDVTVVDLTFTGPTSIILRDPITGVRTLSDGIWQLKVDGQFVKNNVGQRMVGTFLSNTNPVGVNPDLIRRVAGDYNGDGTANVADDPWSVFNPDLPNVVSVTQYVDAANRPVFIDVLFDQLVGIAGLGGFDLYRMIGTSVNFITNTGVASTGISTNPGSAPPLNTDGTIPTTPNTPLPVKPANAVRLWFHSSLIPLVPLPTDAIVQYSPTASAPLGGPPYFPAGGSTGPVVVRATLNSGNWRLVVDPSLIRSVAGNLPMAAPFVFDFVVP